MASNGELGTKSWREAEARQILTVFGTRSEAIKLAPLIRELRRQPKRAVCKVCVTAQRRRGERGREIVK